VRDEGVFEGDLIRPLGLMTLYFGYVEFVVNDLLTRLKETGLLAELPIAMPLGQKVTVLRDMLAGRLSEEAREMIDLIDAGRPLLARRNNLVHACILAQGRVISNTGSRRESTVTPQQLTDFAEELFTWKEQLDVAFQKRLLPILRGRSQKGVGCE